MFFNQWRHGLYSLRKDGTGLATIYEQTSRFRYLPDSNRIAWKTDEDVYLSDLDGTNKVGPVAHVGSASVTFSPCGVYWRGSTGQWSAVSWHGAQELRFPGEPLFSPDCTRIVFANGNQISVSDEAGYWTPVTDALPGHRIGLVVWTAGFD